MAVRDFEAFIRERALLYDPNVDINPGSPFDTQIVQPVVRRLGTDPFSVDLSTFIANRMQQAFPDIANQEEDAVTDLLNKPATLLWDPIVREIIRVRQNLSFADPTQMNAAEADALGANWFSTRRRGLYSRGPGRILFQQAQSISVSPANFFTSKGGLHFFPTETQSIRTEEMLLNTTTDNLYYFDINTIAEKPGTQYNIGPNELISIANIPSATRVTNLRRFTKGESEEGAQDFISRVKQELTERSLVTLRGIAAKLVNSFPEISRLNAMGYNDPEMQRDIIRGGGLGTIIAGGNAGSIVADGEGAALSRRFYTSEVNFITLLGGTREVSGWVLTVFDAFGSVAIVQDISVRRAKSANELDLEEQVLAIGTSGVRWTLRKQELTLSSIPGGILFPNNADGTLTVPDNEIHIGGMTDTYVRGSGFEETTFTVQNVTDDEPLLSGEDAAVTAAPAAPFDNVVLTGLGYGVDFEEGDATWQKLQDAVRFGYTLQIQEGPNAGNYRVTGWASIPVPGGNVYLRVTPTPGTTDATGRRWRLFDVINIDLLEPKETRVSGDDLSILQNSDVVQVPAGTDFNVLGVSEGDVLRILSEASQGDYTILEDPLTPTSLRVDTVLSVTASDLSYVIFRSSDGGALIPPFVRITKVELLDSSVQPVGTTVPYSKPVDVQSRAFQNPARGVKHDLKDATLGLVSQPVGTGFNIGDTLVVYVKGASLAQQSLTITSGVSVPLATVIADLNAEFLAHYGIPEVVVQVGSDRFGIRPVGDDGYVAVVDGSARLGLFGNTELRTTGDVRSASVTDWSTLSPAIDTLTGLDVVQVLDGFNIGYYPGPFTLGYSRSAWSSASPSRALLVGDLDNVDYTPTATFSPANLRRVQVGTRSIGSVRVYFLEPTSFEVDENTVFSLDLGVEGIVNFVPDPTLEYQKLPPLPSDDVAQDGQAVSAGTAFTSASQDFILSGIQPGDKLVIENIPIEGTQSLPDPVSGVAGETLVFALDDEADRTVIFLRDDASLSEALHEVSRAGIVRQINAAAGEDIVELTSDFRLRFITPRFLVIRGTTQSTVNGTILGDVYDTAGARTFTGPTDMNNRSPQAGTYTISTVATTSLSISETFPSISPYITSPLDEQSFRVYRVGVQRISTTEMGENEAEAGLYYFDVELVSEGAGDLWNIDAAQQMTVEGYRSDGYYLTTDDENLTFSEVEKPRLVMSRSILEEGVDDDPANATQLTGENIQITYERSQLVSDVQSFVSSETERVICSNPLSRHLIPNFVRFDVDYVGGSKESVVSDDITNYLKNLSPIDTLDASDVQKLVTDRGATYVRNPLDLIAVVHQIDRSIWVERSQDRLAVDSRLSAFIVDRITVTREVT